MSIRKALIMESTLAVFNNHINNMARTEDSSVSIYNQRLLHAELGIISEFFELKEWANTKRDKTNLIEELGDLMWYTCLGVDALEMKFEDISSYIVTQPEVKLLMKYLDNKLIDNKLIDKVLTNKVHQASDRVKAMLFYNREYPSNVHVELFGAVVSTIIMLAKLHNITIQEISNKNYAKLKARYPEKYSNEKANNRDLNAERKVLEKN
jgi:NTP pyrophosphatase (non-canonical NTP hydrolase)